MTKTTASSNSSDFLSLLSGTVQTGGIILFLEEGMTLVAKELLLFLQQNLAGQIPFAVRPRKALLQGQSGQKNDLLFVGEVTAHEMRELAEKVNSKIVKEAMGVALPEHLYDSLWDASLIPVVQVEKTLKLALQNEVPSVGFSTRALFLDRDDVIVRNVPYNKDPAQVELMPGIVELIQKAHRENQVVVVCSNQSGLGRGLITPHEYQLVHQRMLRLLAEEEAWIDDCYWASHIENSILPVSQWEPHWRKPRSGMFLQAKNKWNIDMKNSCMVGDSATDLIAAYAAGVGHLILFSSEKFQKERQALLLFQQEHPDFYFQDASELEAISPAVKG